MHRPILVCLLVWCSPLWGEVWKAPNIEFELNYADTDKAVQFSGSAASLKVGGGGINLNIPSVYFGSFTAGYGFGYSSNESASFLSVTAAGTAQSKYAYFAYEKSFLLSEKWQVIPFWSRKSYDVEGTLNGEFRNAELKVDANSDITFTDLGMKVQYALSSNTYIVMGASQLNWAVKSSVQGTVSSGLNASTSINEADKSVRQVFGVKTVMAEMPIVFEYSRASLNSDIKVTFEQFKVTLQIFEF